MKVVGVIQARTGSTRYPEKVLRELPFGSGVTVCQQVIRRLKAASRIDEVVVATTTEPPDDRIEDLAGREGVKCFRGSVRDVLSRYYLAAKENSADVVVRITADCPVIDPQIVDRVVGEHLESGSDFTSNILRRTFPHGLDTEVLSFGALETAHLRATEPFEREHVCPYVTKSNPDAFNIRSIEASGELHRPDIRITLDTEQDYALLCAVYDYLYFDNECFGAQEVVRLFVEKPWLSIINKNVVHKKIFDSPRQELEEAIRVLDLQELTGAKKLLMSHLQ